MHVLLNLQPFWRVHVCLFFRWGITNTCVYEQIRPLFQFWILCSCWLHFTLIIFYPYCKFLRIHWSVFSHYQKKQQVLNINWLTGKFPFHACTVWKNRWAEIKEGEWEITEPCRDYCYSVLTGTDKGQQSVKGWILCKCKWLETVYAMAE